MHVILNPPYPCTRVTDQAMKGPRVCLAGARLDQRTGEAPAFFTRIQVSKGKEMHHESDSYMQMIEYTTAGKGKRLGLFVHHTDA